MINGVKRRELTVAMIMEHLTPEDIYFKYFGAFKVNEACKNWMRKEHESSFIIGNKSGTLRHFDFSSYEWRGNCFNFVMQLYNCNFHEALVIINNDFGLGLLEDNKPKERKIIIKYTPEVIKKDYSNIQIVTRKFLPLELNYWKAYGINEEELKKEKIYSIKELYLNKQRFPLPDNEIRFGYLYGDKIKVYRPNNGAKTKWMPNNCALNYLEGKENIVNCDILWITKSKKDKMVLLKLYPFVIAVQNESIGCFSAENVRWIKENSKRQILLFDNDKAGKKASAMIAEQFGFEQCFVPDSYISDGISDFADLVRYYGIDKLEMLLIKKKLL